MNDIDNVLVPISNKWMCSAQCACNQDEAHVYLNLNPSIVQLFDRRTPVNDLNDDPSAVETLFVDPDWNYNPEQVLYSTFQDCFLQW